MSPDVEQSIRCSEPGCSCVCFRPGSVRLRSCGLCGHGWVAHALEKLQAHPPSSRGPVEVALPGPVFDLSSLVLYGAQAVPVQLKILLDRLYSILSPEQVGQILQTLGWSLGDYIRGYMLQYPRGKVLDRWSMVTPEEKLLVLKQFLRFGETRPIVELMMLQCLEGDDQNSDPESGAAVRNNQSNIKKNKETQGVSPLIGKNNPVHHGENVLGGQSMLLPFHFPHSNIPCLLPSTEGFSKLTQILQKSSGSEVAERRDPKGGKTGKDDDLMWKRAECEPAIAIKTDPDKSSPLLSLWHQTSGFPTEQELLLQRGMTRQEKTASLSSPSNSSLIPSSLLYPPISNSSSSHLQISQKLQGSASSLHHLPSFSSSFLCSLRNSSFSSPMLPLPSSSSSSSSSLHPLPSSLCTFPSLSCGGSRKGRVCCGVCGKSFYDKGTLKIHYNAVHLKIKHRCTIVGCTMVFSSLRSRNRHSANPNPRLHTGACRDAQLYRSTHANIHTETQMLEDKQDPKHKYERQMCRERGSSNIFWQQSNDTQPLLRANAIKNIVNGHLSPQRGCRSNTPQEGGSPILSFHPQTVDQNSNRVISTNNSQGQIPPLLLPTGTDSSEGSPSCCSSLVTNQQWRWRLVDLLPKKKPRKSSMPMKIKREHSEQKA